MKKTIIGGALLLLALFGCKGKTTTKKEATTVKPTTNASSSSSKVTTTNKSTTQKTSTKDYTGALTLTLATDTSADTATLKNTIKIMNKTKNVEMKNGDTFDSGDIFGVTLFNAASDVKLRITSGGYDVFPWFSYDQLTGSDVEVGQEEIEIELTANVSIMFMVDDGEETVTYAKFNSSITATDVEVTIKAAGMDEAEHDVVDGDTVAVGSTLYYTIKNKSTTNKVIFAYFDGNELDVDATVVIEPNSTLDDYNGIMGDTKVCIEPYVEYKADSTSVLPTGTSVTIYEGTNIINGVDKQKYTVINVFVNNSSVNNYLAKVMIDGAAIESKLLEKNTNYWFENILLTDNIEVVIESFEGPTATINTCDGVYLSAGYLIGDEETGFVSGDTIPEGLELSLTAFNITDPYKDLTITITVGGVEVYSETIVANEYGLYINGIYATDTVVITIS